MAFSPSEESIKLVQPDVELLEDPKEHYRYLVEKISSAGWTSTRFNGSDIPFGEKEKFIKTLIKRKHLSVLEHGTISVLILADRGFLAEITRHRVGIAFTAESTRYCNYSKTRFGGKIEIIDPRSYSELGDAEWQHMIKVFEHASNTYNYLTSEKIPAEIARSVLPLALACRVYVTANIREWRYIIELRSKKDNQPLMRKIMQMLLELFKKNYPVFFEDL